MERTLKVATVAMATALLMAPAMLGGTAATTTARAERNILGATKTLNRWHVGITDPRTRLVRANTTVTCRGRGRHQAQGYASFTCVIRRRTLKVRVLYVALTGNGFELRHHVLLHR